MAVLSDFDFIQADYQGENGIITKATLIALIGGDTDTFSVASQALSAGTDVTGKAYGVADWILTTSGGNVISLAAPAAGTDTFAVPATAATAGTDAAGNAYSAGAPIVILADGSVYAMQHVDPATPGVDTFATAAPATAAGTDTSGVAYEAGTVVLTLPSGDEYVLSHPDAPSAACCVGAPVCAYDPTTIPNHAGECGDANSVAVGAVNDMLLDATGANVNLYKSDGSQWEIVPNGTLADLTSFTCTSGDVWVYYTANSNWVMTGALPAIADPRDPATWPMPVAPATVHAIVDPLGYLLGTVDSKGPHPIANEIGAPLIVGANVTAPVWTGICGDPNIVPVGADGDYLIDVTSQPINTFVAETGSWDLIPRSTIADLTEFQCTNTPDTYLFDAAQMNWLPGAQPMDTSADDPSTWGTVVFPTRKRCVYNLDGEMIGVVDATGGHLLAHPLAATTGTAAPSGAPVPNNSGHATPMYIQTPVSNAQTEQTDLNILWWYDGTAWLRVNDLVLPNARDDHRGIVELATPAETQAGTDNQRAVTPAGLKSELDICKAAITAEIDADVAAEAAIREANDTAEAAARVAGDNAEAAARAAADAAEANARAAADAAEVAARNAAIAAAIASHVATYHTGGGVPGLTDVGSVAMAYTNISANLAAGATRPGSQIFWSESTQTNGAAVGPGTWRAHFQANYGGGPGQEQPVGLWMRIS